MMGKPKYFFLDRECEENFTDGLPYFAAGIVECEGVPGDDDKDFLVSYIDPWGSPRRAYRAAKSVQLIEASAEDFDMLQNAIEQLWQN